MFFLFMIGFITGIMMAVSGPQTTDVPEQASVPQGQTVMIDFLSNPTTGYAWVCEVEDASLVAVRDQFFEDSGELGFVGVGGTHWFHLSGLRPGTTSVTFRYLRSWEPDTPAAQTTYRISVDERLNVLIWGVEVA